MTATQEDLLDLDDIALVPGPQDGRSTAAWTGDGDLYFGGPRLRIRR
jgi:hypothetical protein